MKRDRPFVSLALPLALAACISPADFESEPVSVETPHGPVMCQLYTRERLDWDRAIDRPESMSVQVADEVCRAEGQRIAKGG